MKASEAHEEAAKNLVEKIIPLEYTIIMNSIVYAVEAGLNKIVAPIQYPENRRKLIEEGYTLKSTGNTKEYKISW